MAWTGRCEGADNAPALTIDRPAQVEPGSAAPTVSETSTMVFYRTSGAGVKDYLLRMRVFLHLTRTLLTPYLPFANAPTTASVALNRWAER